MIQVFVYLVIVCFPLKSLRGFLPLPVRHAVLPSLQCLWRPRVLHPLRVHCKLHVGTQISEKRKQLDSVHNLFWCDSSSPSSSSSSSSSSSLVFLPCHVFWFYRASTPVAYELNSKLEGAESKVLGSAREQIPRSFVEVDA